VQEGGGRKARKNNEAFSIKGKKLGSGRKKRESEAQNVAMKKARAGNGGKISPRHGKESRKGADQAYRRALPARIGRDPRSTHRGRSRGAPTSQRPGRKRKMSTGTRREKKENATQAPGNGGT